MSTCFLLSSTARAIAAALGGLSLVACQTSPPQDADSVPIEDAKKQRIIFRSIESPPRTIEDIRALLTQSPEAPSRPREAALVKESPPSTNNNEELAKFYWERGRAAGWLGLIQQQIADLRKAAEYAGELNTNDVEGTRILTELSAAEMQGGNMLTSIRVRERSVEKEERSPKKRVGQLVASYAVLAEHRLLLGDREGAKEALAKAESRLADGKQRRNYDWFRHNWPAFVVEAQAAMLEHEGRYADAEPLRRQALTDRIADIEMNVKRRDAGIAGISQELVVHRRGVAESLLARNLVKQQRVAEAEAVIRKQVYRAVKGRGRYSPRTGNSFWNLAQVLYEQGRYAEAREMAEVAIDIYQKTGVQNESFGVVKARRARAAAFTAEGRYRDALAELETMKAGLASDSSLAAKLARGDIDWTLALVRTGNAAAAIPMADELVADTRARVGEQHYETAEARGFLALAQAKAGQYQAALGNFRQALPVLMAGAETTDGVQRAPARMRRLIIITEAYIELLGDPQGSGLARGAGIDPVGEAFMLADLARGSSVLRALTSGAARAAATEPKLAELVQREQDLNRQITATEELLANLFGAPPSEQLPKHISQLQREIKELGSERKTVFAEIVRQFPSYANLISPKPATLERVRASLTPGEVLIAVYTSAERSFVWAVPRQGPAAFAVAALGEAAIAEAVTHLRKSLDPGTATLGDMPAFDVAAAHRLYAQLLKPVEHTWKNGDTLLVVANRRLAQLPFALLPTAPTTLKADRKLLFDAYREVPWLARKAAVVQLPTANAIVTLRALPPGDPKRRAFAGFGDPIFSPADAAPNSPRAEQVALAARGLRSYALPLRNLKVAKVSGKVDEEVAAATNVANSSGLAQVPRLPDTADEIREIAAVLKAEENEDVFLHLRASEEQVLRADLANRRVLMFATHGLVPGDLDGLNQPALALSAPQLTGGNGDGLLTMNEVLGLRLNADWVVLSACNTASGQGAGAEAISGLGRAFFYAGSRALLVTHWPVETTSARALTTTLFRQQAANAHLTRAEALRQSMLTLIDGPGHIDRASGKSVYAYAHPLFWAPFALIGDGAGR